MKRTILFVLLLSAITSCKSQEEINFKVGYLPNLNYTLTQKQISENTVKYFASDQFLQNLENNGIKNPTSTKDTTILKSISKTGRSNGNEFPIKIELLESTNPTLISGTKFFGKSIAGMTKIDSISSFVMTKEKKEVLIPAMESLMNQIKYPNRKIKVGESFEQKNPMSMPIGDVTIEIEINSIYTLEEVKDGIGYFDLDQVYTIESATKDYEMELDGTGKGRINYDIEKEFFTKFFLETTMNLKTELEAFAIELQTKSITDQSTEIEKAAGNNI
ncbi:hypothetical protein GCM10007103_35380 [Salinimicrobium marinum]|uniref:Uncharacterized protein n=1 Tax=Salinimicrobium marinum TaxID=680283 RepID=A0A918SN71_9FLAO|nr:hypothetical protein [Salinimicrobium marinum]GHA51863.1 hypothetical protein GCM10007103_35380 [Salinimicrobium marinum]